MRFAAIAVLCALLGVVYWLGATVYSEKIELDISERTQTEIEAHRADIPVVSRNVDGRDVTVFGESDSQAARDAAGEDVLDVWGVRVLDNRVTVATPKADPPQDLPTYSLHAEHSFPELTVYGQVDDPSYNTIADIHRALPPDSLVNFSGLDVTAPELLRGPRIVETGIAAVTQLNPGSLLVTDTQFVLEGSVYSEDRKRTIEQLIDVRRAEIEPLEIIVNITVQAPGITQACREGLNSVLSNNVLNYAVDHYKVLDSHASVLEPMAETVLGVCQGQIENVLVEGHADYTGGAGYNQGLSERRSGTVRDRLIEIGVEPAQISAFGYGEFRPIASNETVEGRARNRRTEIYLLIHDQLTGTVLPAVSFSDE